MVRERVGRRLVCPVCDPQRRRPAAVRRFARCAVCAASLERRTSDDPETLTRRLARCRRFAPATRAALQAGGLAWHTVDADRDQPDVRAAALDAFRSLIPAQRQNERTGLRRPSPYR